MGALGTLLLFALAASPAEATITAAPAESVWQSTEWTDLSGRRWTPEDLDGRVVLLDFWATWCAPCLAEFPHLRQLHERLAERGFVLVGVALDTLDRRRLRSFLLRHDLTWPQVHEKRAFEGELAGRFEVATVPATVLVDRRGRVVACDLRGRALEVSVEALLDLGDGQPTSSRVGQDTDRDANHVDELGGNAVDVEILDEPFPSRPSNPNFHESPTETGLEKPGDLLTRQGPAAQ